MTWNDLVSREPQLARIRKRAAAMGGRDVDDETWCFALKPAFSRLVGWYAERPELATSRAYEVAYRAILDAYETGSVDANE